MQNSTDFRKKFITGIGCGLSIFFLSHYSNAEQFTVLSNSPPAAMSSASHAGDNHAAASIPVATAPINAAESVNTIEPINTAQPINTAPQPSSAKSISAPVKTNSASQLASLIGGLALILVLIYGLSWFVKRFSQGGFLHNPTMKIVSAMPLGTRERLMLVDVGGKQLLLGVTATQINTLHVFNEPVVESEKIQPVASDFSQRLMAILQQKNVLPADDAVHKKPNL